MIVQRFLAWVQTAPVGARAEATSALARAYLYSDLTDRDRADAEAALTSMLDDPSPLVRRALAEVGAREAVISLAVNPAADAPDDALRRIIERFGDDGEVREAMLGRPDLSAGARADLVLAATRALSSFVVERGWMPEERVARVGREAVEKGFRHHRQRSG
jgi:uncharacterized protein (DUF2336 family)